jgi:hypothetical protein
VTADDGIQDESWFRGLHEDSKSRLLEQAFKYANHPRENVSWYQAVAFTRWLTLKYQQAGIIGHSMITFLAVTADFVASALKYRWSLFSGFWVFRFCSLPTSIE